MASNFIIVSDDFEATNNKIEEIKQGYNITSETITYDLSDENVYSLVDELTTISLFEDVKFVVVKEAEELLGKNEKAFIELQKAMNDVYSNNILILLYFIRERGFSDALLGLLNYSWSFGGNNYSALFCMPIYI